MKHMKENKVGIDIGRVIIGPVVGGKADTSFLGGSLGKAMQTLPSEGAFEGVKSLVELFHGNAWLISKCGPNVQFKTKEWLKHNNFYTKTKLDRRNVRFCLERPQKANHCKQLRISHFIDDRLDVLENLRGLVPNLYLFGEQPDDLNIPNWVEHCLNWEETVDLVSKSLS